MCLCISTNASVAVSKGNTMTDILRKSVFLLFIVFLAAACGSSLEDGRYEVTPSNFKVTCTGDFATEAENIEAEDLEPWTWVIAEGPDEDTITVTEHHDETEASFTMEKDGNKYRWNESHRFEDDGDCEDYEVRLELQGTRSGLKGTMSSQVQTCDKASSCNWSADLDGTKLD